VVLGCPVTDGIVTTSSVGTGGRCCCWRWVLVLILGVCILALWFSEEFKYSRGSNGGLQWGSSYCCVQLQEVQLLEVLLPYCCNWCQGLVNAESWKMVIYTPGLNVLCHLQT
jgi:hypothetical protein